MTTHGICIISARTWGVVFLIILHFIAKAGCINMSRVDLLDKLFDGYDSRISPNYYAGNTTLVLVQMYVITIDSISETSMDYKLSMFLRQRWNDKRLVFNATDDLQFLELDLRMMDKLWIPDMYILSEKKAEFHDVTVPNKLMHIYPNGDVQYSMRVTGIFSCPMQLVSYPFDKQICRMEFESYGHSTKSIIFRWHEKDVTRDESLELPQYELIDVSGYSCDRPYYGIMYTCIGALFTFERNYGYYVIQIYVPSILIVILSWVNFWLDCESVPARISLGLLTVLTMTTQLSGARVDLPRVSYVKAIDVWMAVCLTFVFAGLVEFALVNVLSRKERRKKQSYNGSRESVDFSNIDLKINGDAKNNNQDNGRPRSASVIIPSKCICFRNMVGIERARVVDKLSRVLFPLVFVAFNAVYWVYYLYLWKPDAMDSPS